MKNIKINFESLPTRCEICHQVDCFDPQINRCSRCEKIMDDEEPSYTKKEKRPLDYGDRGLIYGTVCGAMIGVLAQEIHIYSLGNYSSTIKLSYWIIIGLALLCAFWGAAIGETIQQSRSPDTEIKKNTVVFNLWKH